MPSEGTATVWAATFVPSKSPITGFGQEGYSVAWVDTPNGREQVLVSGSRPAPGAKGRIIVMSLGEEQVPVFVTDPA
jgi:hypothetical protein